MTEVEGWGLETLLDDVLIAHVEDVFHNVFGLNLGTAPVRVHARGRGLDLATGLAGDEAALTRVVLGGGGTSNVVQGYVHVVLRAAEGRHFRAFAVLPGNCAASVWRIVNEYLLYDVGLKLIKVLGISVVSGNARLNMVC